MKKIKSFSRRFVYLSWTGFSIAVISIAVLLSVARMILPLVGEYKVEIEQWISVKLDRQLKIGDITAAWNSFNPSLIVSDVSLLSEDGRSSWIDIDEIKVSVNILSLLYGREVETGVIKIIGTSISLEHHDDGGYSLNGIRMGEGNLRSWLFSRKHISVLNSEFNLKDPRIGDGILLFKDASIVLENFGQHHQIRGLLSLPDQEERSLSFVLDIDGDIQSKPEELESRLYAEGDALFGPWLSKWGFKSVKFNAGEAKFHIWAGGSLKKVKWVEGDIGLHELDWRLVASDDQDNIIGFSEADEQAFKINKVSGSFFWADTGNGWSLDIEDFNFSREISQAWPASYLNLTYRQPKDGDPLWEGRFSFIRIQDLHALLLSNVALAAKVREKVHTLNPRGDLYDLNFRYIDRGGGEIAHYFLKTQFEDLALNEWEKVPGFTGFDGDLMFNQDRGYLQLSTREATIDFGDLFRAPLQFDELTGKIYGSRTGKGIVVESDHITASNQDVHTESKFTLSHHDGEGSPFLHLRGSLSRGSIEKAHHYLPVRIMRPGLVSWLDNALVSGRIDSGGVLVHGRLSDFPFDSGKGIFEVRFAANDTILQYGKDWPRAEELAADITFHGRTFNADIGSAKLFDMDVLPTTVSINNMTQDPDLELKLEVNGTTPGLLRFLRESPAGGGYRDVLKKMKSEGESKLSLDLLLPIFNKDQRRFSGEVLFSDSNLDIKDWGARLSELNGKLDYSYGDSGYRFTADKMTANFNESKSSVDVNSVDNNSGINEKHINIYTHMEVKNILGERYTGILPKMLKGEADWMLSLQIKPESDELDNVVLHVESDLKGVEVSMPGYLNKPLDQERSFNLNIHLSGQEAGEISLSYGKILNARLLYEEENNKSSLKKGALHFGDKQAALPERAGLMISGYLPEISISEWEDWLSNITSDKQQGSIAELINKLDLSVDKLDMQGFRFHEVKLNASRQLKYWDAKIQSREISGDVRLPFKLDGDTPIVLDLEKLHIKVTGDKKTISLNPKEFPALRLSSKSFQFDDIDFGKTSLVARKVQDGILFESIEMQSPYLGIMANGSWELKNNQQVSNFSINANSRDLGQVLQDLGYEGAIDGGTMNASLKANWEGSPTAFELAALNGELDLKIYNGQLLPIETGGGKIFGLLSLQALPRRLSLDFSDLFKRGFGFDSIQGKFSIADGEAYTNDLYMIGPAARIEASGRIGLARRDYDQTVFVTPLVTSSIPVIGGLAGGPAVGLGLWVAERMFGSEINKISRVQYTITGSWDSPIIERIDDTASDAGVEKKMKKESTRPSSTIH